MISTFLFEKTLEELCCLTIPDGFVPKRPYFAELSRFSQLDSMLSELLRLGICEEGRECDEGVSMITGEAK
jgi:hypothetical protein